jgi:hypothetical protein
MDKNEEELRTMKVTRERLLQTDRHMMALRGIIELLRKLGDATVKNEVELDPTYIACALEAPLDSLGDFFEDLGLGHDYFPSESEVREAERQKARAA